MFLEDLQLIKPSNSGVGAPFQNVAAAVAAAQANNQVVVVGAGYNGGDYNAITTSASASAGVAPQSILDLRPFGAHGTPVATAQLTGIASATTAANFVSSIPPAGLYKVDYYLLVTTTFTTAGPKITVGYTDSAFGANTQLSAATPAVTAGSSISGSIVLQSSGTAQITWLVSAPGGVFGVAAVYATLTRLA